MKRRRDKEEADDDDSNNPPKRQKLSSGKWLGKESSTSNNNKDDNDDSNNNKDKEDDDDDSNNDKDKDDDDDSNNNKDKEDDDDDSNNNKDKENDDDDSNNSWILGGTQSYTYSNSFLIQTKVRPIIELDTIEITSCNPLDRKYMKIINATVRLWAVKDQAGIDSPYTIMVKATITENPWAETLNCNVNKNISWKEIDKLITNYVGNAIMQRCPIINIWIKNLNVFSNYVEKWYTHWIHNKDSIVAASFNKHDITKIFIAVQIWFSHC